MQQMHLLCWREKQVIGLRIGMLAKTFPGELPREQALTEEIPENYNVVLSCHYAHGNHRS